VPEELLHVLLVAVFAGSRPGGASQVVGSGEVVHRSGTCVAVLESGVAQAGSVDAATECDQPFHLRRELHAPEALQGSGEQAGPNGRERHQMGADDGGDLGPGELSLASHVEDAGDPVGGG
jgi:hypothetical protein